MGINTKQLIELIIQPTLKGLGLYSLEAEMLLAGTCAQESGMGTYLQQIGGGPALGIWMIEPETYEDIWDNFLCGKHELTDSIGEVCFDYIPTSGRSNDLIFNLKYACAMCRIHYLRVSEPIPKDLPGLARYYKQHYNTPNGAATEQQFIENWNKYCASYYGSK